MLAPVSGGDDVLIGWSGYMVIVLSLVYGPASTCAASWYVPHTTGLSPRLILRHHEITRTLPARSIVFISCEQDSD